MNEMRKLMETLDRIDEAEGTTVYLVERGWDYEGRQAMGVYASYEAALRAIKDFEDAEIAELESEGLKTAKDYHGPDAFEGGDFYYVTPLVLGAPLNKEATDQQIKSPRELPQ